MGKDGKDGKDGKEHRPVRCALRYPDLFPDYDLTLAAEKAFEVRLQVALLALLALLALRVRQRERTLPLPLRMQPMLRHVERHLVSEFFSDLKLLSLFELNFL